MILILLALACQDSIESLVQDLGHELIEVREQAQRQLLAHGPKGVTALREALKTADGEFRIRATIILEIVGRVDRERAHDADQRNALLLVRRKASDIEAEHAPGSAATEGARFELKATPYDGGWIVATSVRDYMFRRCDPGPGKGLVTFDLPGIADATGRDVPIERCGSCSPRLVFVRCPQGPLKVRVKGNQTWFSPYHLEFKDPAVGHSRRVGGFAIEVKGFHLEVTSETSFPFEWTRSMNTNCTYDVKPGITLHRARYIACGGLRSDGRRGDVKKQHWCDCPNGPQPVVARPLTFISYYSVTQPIDVDPSETADEPRPISLQDFARITYTFWKPLEIPIDLTVTVPAK